MRSRLPAHAPAGTTSSAGGLGETAGETRGLTQSSRKAGVGSARGGVSTNNVTLAGSLVAYSTSSVVVESESTLYVLVRNLRTGRTLTDVPTGVPLKSRPHYTGVGDVRMMALNSRNDAWIASDRLRSENVEHETGHEANYHDLYALDGKRERLLRLVRNLTRTRWRSGETRCTGRWAASHSRPPSSEHRRGGATP